MILSQLPRPLITARQLYQMMQQVKKYPGPELVVLDASWFLTPENTAHKNFLNKRIPGAKFFDIDAIITPSKVPHMLPSPQLFAESVGKLGINNDSQVVVYDTKGLFSSPRAWFTLRVFGHENVSILDGGFPAWLADSSLKVETGPVENCKPEIFYADYCPNLVVNLDQVKKEVLKDPKTDKTASRQVVDARSEPRFLGVVSEPRKGIPSGHMPNAVNIPFTSVFNPQGEKVHDSESLREMFTKKNVKYDQPFIASCGSGINACQILLAAYILGNKRASLYDGSWTEYASQPNAVIESEAPANMRF